MIILTALLKALGPGYWVEFRYIEAGLEVNLHFRHTPKDLVTRKALIFSQEYILQFPKMVEGSIHESAKELQAAVNTKLKK